MGITGASQHSYTFDELTQLKDPGAVTATGAGTVAAAARVLDFGNTTPQGIVQVAYTSALLVVDITAMSRTAGDEAYEIQFQLADDDSDFSAATTVVVKAAFQVGEERGLNVTAQAATSLGRNVIGVDNEYKGTIFRFARIAHLIAGTPTPSIEYTAFLSSLRSRR